MCRCSSFRTYASLLCLVWIFGCGGSDHADSKNPTLPASADCGESSPCLSATIDGIRCTSVEGSVSGLYIDQGVTGDRLSIISHVMIPGDWDFPAIRLPATIILTIHLDYQGAIDGACVEFIGRIGGVCEGMIWDHDHAARTLQIDNLVVDWESRSVSGEFSFSYDVEFEVGAGNESLVVEAGKFYAENVEFE